MDNPATESTAPLSVNEAASFFDSALSGKEPEKASAAAAPQAAAGTPAAAPAEPAKEPQKTDALEGEDDASEQEAQKVTIEVDGKTVELTPQQIAEVYKSGLRQEDYTKKTMATAEQRKAAEAEAARARDERQQYATGLQQARAMLQAQLHEQQQTVNFQELLDTNPQEYLKQKHLWEQRQANLQEVHQREQVLFQRHQEEQAQFYQTHLQAQREELLAKLPEWKDPVKADAERGQIREYMKAQGFDERTINNVADNRTVVMLRKAMLYDQLMDKAQAATKKVSTLPQKVERPGGGETTGLDGRTAVYKRFEKSGSLRDAGNVFATLL